MKSFALLLLTVAATRILLAQSGPTAYYPFDGNANDGSGNGNHGIVFGASLTSDRFGNPGQAYQFNGTSNYISVPISPSLQLAGSMTVLAWVRMDAGALKPSTCVITSGVLNTSTDWALIVDNTATPGVLHNRPHMWINSWRYFNGSTTLRQSQWHLVAMSYDGSTMRSYVDGMLDGSYGVAGSLRAASSNLLIGAYSTDQYAGWFAGAIDDIRIYNRRLSDAEIAALYDEGGARLIAYYPFNANANDESGNERHGTNVGASLTLDRFGKPNSAYHFDGVSSYIKASGVALPKTARAVSLWFKAAAVNNKPGLLGYGGSGACGTSWHMGLNIMGTGSYVVTSHCRVRELLSTYTPEPLNSWIHWVVTSGPSGTRMYLNGRAVDSNAVYFDNTYTEAGDLAFGTLVSWSGLAPYTDGNSGNFAGDLDEIRVYSSSLTAAQVDSLYKFESAGPPRLISPNADSVTSAPSMRLVWSPGAPASSPFWLEVAGDSAFTVSSVDSTITDTSKVVGLSRAGAYWWRVRQKSGTTWGTFSETRRFQYTISVNGLVAWYSFSGNANDSSGNERHGTVSGATLGPNRFGFVNSAYSFDGTNDFIRASCVGLPSKARTISLWFKANSVANRPILLGYGGSTCGTSWFQGLNVEGNASYMVNSHCNVRKIAVAYPNPPTGMWHQWTVTTGPSGTNMYVDGVLIASNGGYFDNTFTLGGEISFGVNVNWSGVPPFTNVDGGYFNGSLDDIRVYDYPLSASQVDSLYRMEAAPPEPGAIVIASPTTRFVTGADTAAVRWYRGGPVVTRYWLETSPDSVFEFTKVDSMVVDTSYVLRNLVPAKEYWWRVRAYSGWSYGPFSAPRSIHVVTAPGQAQLLLPAHGQVLSADSAVLSWQQAQQFVDRYAVEFAMDSVFTLKFADSTVGGTTYIVRGLTRAVPYWWRVKAHNAAGWGPFSTKRSFSALFTGVGVSEGLPQQFALEQNYPNPFNPTTVIGFQLPVASDVRLVVYDMLGRAVAVLVNEKRHAGVHKATFDASALGTGMYLYRISARAAEGGQVGEFVQTRKLILVK